MKLRIAIPAALALTFGAAGVASAQTTPPAQTTTPAQTTMPARPTAPATTAMPNATMPNATMPATTTPAPAGSTMGAGPSNNAVSTSSANNSHSPVPGANSFTMGEARSRIQRHGYKQVTDLKLDKQGVWRGKAQKNGQSVGVAVDYQGNVTQH